jgi:uncharacterized protein (TIGR03437 family)
MMIMHRSSKLISVVWFCSMCFGPPTWAQSASRLATAYQDDTHFYVENDWLKIAFLRTTGNLDGIVHKQSGVNLQSRTMNDFPTIWGISLNTSAGTHLFVNSGQAITCSGTINTTGTNASLSLTWKGLQYLPNGLPSMPDVTITAQISVRTDSPLSYWTIQASGLGTNSISSINFPNISGIGPLGQNASDDMLLTSEFKGTLYHNPTANVQAGSYPGGFYPSATALMQFMAYFDPASGFYFACDDNQGYTKDLYWAKSTSPAGDFTINIEYFPPGQPMDSVPLPYNVLIGATQGDWYAPADLYRNWAVRQLWTQKSRTKQVPAWLHDLPVIRNTCAHGCGTQPDQTYANAVQEWQQSQQALGVAALGELWGWEQFGAWADGDYFPPQEGWSSFDAMVHAAPSSRLDLFPSALYLDTNTSLYKSGAMAVSAMLDQSGKALTQPGAASLTGDTWALMDISTDPWRQYVVNVFQTLAQHGVDLIQFDSSMEAGPQPCYSPSHLHPPGNGGNWQTTAWIDLLQKTAAAVATANPDAALAAEEPAEIYVPYVAVYHGSAIDQYETGSQFTNYKEPVPLFQYVYHDSILFKDFFGPPVLDGSYFRLALARDLTWGQIPDYQIPVGYTPALEPMAEAYLKSDIAARTGYAKKFLVDGMMLPAPQLNVPTTPVTWVTNWTTNTTATAQYPSVWDSAWSAADGAVGIVLTNIAPNNLTVSLPISYGRLQLPAGSAYTVQTTDGITTATLDSNLVQDSSYSIPVAPGQILLVLLTPKAAQPRISTGGVVLHASTSNTVSPGSLVDIYGANFAPAPLTAPSSVALLPVLLGTTQVLINGIPAPLLYVGPSQVVAQLPWTTAVGNASVVVRNGGAASVNATINVQPAAPGILTYAANHAIAQNSDYSLNSSSNPAAAGSAAIVYLIGSGPVSPPLDDGAPAPASPLSWESLPATVTVGSAPAQVLFAGMTPGFVGLVQVNFYVPDLPSGDYPIQVTIGSAQSNAPVISVVH